MTESKQPVCPKCGGTMQRGFLLDKGAGNMWPLRWIEESPEKSWWRGLNITNRRKIEIRADRCVTCGYLELYAGP